MSHIVDVRHSGGNFIILGDAITFPSASADITLPLTGAVRYNPATDTVEIFGQSRQWQAIAGQKGDPGNQGIPGPVGPMPSLAGTVVAVEENYTTTNADLGKMLLVTGNDVTITVHNAPVGFNFIVKQERTTSGQVTFVGAGVSIENRLDHSKTAGPMAVVGVQVWEPGIATLAGDTGE